MTTQCIITGCVLADLQSNRTLIGDLFADGHVFIFVGNMTKQGNANWDYDGAREELTADRCRFSEVKMLVVPNGERSMFERRGVVVTSSFDSELNPAACRYLKGN